MKQRLLRAWRWFIGRRYTVCELTDSGHIESAVSEHRYRIHIEPVPDNGAVLVAINIIQHPILNRWRQAQPPAERADFLSLEVPPDEVDEAKVALVRDADRRVRAIEAAWEHGWRPAG